VGANDQGSNLLQIILKKESKEVRKLDEGIDNRINSIQTQLATRLGAVEAAICKILEEHQSGIAEVDSREVISNMSRQHLLRCSISSMN